MPDFQLDEKRLSQLDGNIKQMISSGASEGDVMRYAADFKNQFGVKKKDQGFSPSVSSTGKSQSGLPDFEKGRAFAEKGFLMQAEGTKAPKPEKRISFEPSLSNMVAPFEVKVLEEGEEPSFASDLMTAGARGQIQGKVANLLPAGKVPTNEELGEIAQLQTDAKLLPQSKAEKAYQEKGLKGLFSESPLLGAQFVGETMLSSLASLAEASTRTLPTAVAAGAGAGAAFGGIGALPGAAMGLLAGQSAAGYNLSTSQDILNSLSENGVDISNKESLIKAFSDENKMAKIRNTAAKYGIPILLFDAATAGLAGKLAAGAMGKSLSRKLLAGLGEAGIQMTGGAGGELAGQIASGKKVNWDDVAVEAIAEVPGGAVEVATGIALERSKTSSNNNTLATQIATQGPEDGTKDAVLNLNRDLANSVITPEQHQEGINFVEKAVQVSSKIPETVTGESKAKSIELLVERNDIKEGNQILEQQKQATDEAYHAGIDEEIKANEEKIKKIDSEVYNIAKNPIPVKEKPVVQISEQEIIEPEPTKVLPIEEVTVSEEVKPTEEVAVTEEVKPAEVKNVEQLRSEEQAELDSKIENAEQYRVDGKVDRSKLTNEEDIKNFDEVYKKYDKLITPLLEQEVKPAEAEQSERIPARYKTINIDEQIAKNDEIIKSGSPLDKSFARMSNKDLLKAKSLGKKEYQITEKPPKGYNKTTIGNKEYYTKQKEFKTQSEVKPVAPKKEEKGLSMKGIRASETRKINQEANKIEVSDARSAALKYLSGANLSREAIDELFGRKKASLNTDERKLKSNEAKLRDYVAKLGEGDSLRDAAHAIWQDLPESVREGKSEKADTQAIQDELEKVISEYKTKAEAAKALIEGYREESLEDQELEFYRRYSLTEDEIDAELALIEESLDIDGSDEYDFNLPEEHINNLIEQYEAETKNKIEQPTEGIKEEGTKKISDREASEQKKLEKSYKDLTNIEKRQIINSKFEELLKELKIEKICPTD